MTKFLSKDCRYGNVWSPETQRIEWFNHIVWVKILVNMIQSNKNVINKTIENMVYAKETNRLKIHSKKFTSQYLKRHYILLKRNPIHIVSLQRKLFQKKAL